MYTLSKADRQFLEQHRGVYDKDSQWYGVMTHGGHERRVRERIVEDFGADGVEEVLLPELDKQDRVEDLIPKNGLLFGNYVFLRCRLTDAIYMNIAALPKVFKILGPAFRIPQIIPDEEIQIFKGVLKAVPRPQMVQRSQVGQTATVIAGLMRGLEGRIIGASAQFVKIEASFSFLDPGNALVVSVPQEQVLLLGDETGQEFRRMFLGASPGN